MVQGKFWRWPRLVRFGWRHPSLSIVLNGYYIALFRGIESGRWRFAFAPNAWRR